VAVYTGMLNVSLTMFCIIVIYCSGESISVGSMYGEWMCDAQ